MSNSRKQILRLMFDLAYDRGWISSFRVSIELTNNQRINLMEKKNYVLKKLERYLSMRKRRVAPTGCFTVYVGAEKQRFVIKTEYANHPLFKMLLEDAELEYGFSSEGPLLLPCNVDLFCKILAEMDAAPDIDDPNHAAACGFTYGGGCSPFNPTSRRRLGSDMGGSYGLLTPTRLLRINHFWEIKLSVIKLASTAGVVNLI